MTIPARATACRFTRVTRRGARERLPSAALRDASTGDGEVRFGAAAIDPRLLGRFISRQISTASAPNSFPAALTDAQDAVCNPIAALRPLFKTMSLRLVPTHGT